MRTGLFNANRVGLTGRAAFFFMFAALIGISVWPPAAANAHSYKLGDIAVGHVWAPPPEKAATGIPIYGPILNRGDKTVQLISASTPIAEEVRFRADKEGEVRWPTAVELRPGKPFALAAWREHIWLSGLKKPLKNGDSFDLILDFGDAGTLTVQIVVEKASGH